MPDSGLRSVRIVPAGLPQLAFSLAAPADWVNPPIPEDPPDFSDPTEMQPLFIAMAPYGAVVLTAAARPAFGDGTVEDWVEYLAEHSGLSISRIFEARTQGQPAVFTEASQESEMGAMRVWALFVEDGGRLYHLGAMAPEAIWPSVEPAFDAAFGSFLLEECSGPTTQLMRRMTADPPMQFPRGTGEVHSGNNSAETHQAAEMNTEAHNQVDTEDPRTAGNTPTDPWPATQPHEVALSDDDTTFDPAHPQNIRMLENGTGFVPNRVMTSHRHKFASFAAAAVQACFRVPFGWFILDDGRRTLVYDPEGKMQINLSLRTLPGEELTSVLDAVLVQLTEESQGFEVMKLMLGEYPCLAVRGIQIEGEVLDQAYLARMGTVPGLALVVRVTASREDITFALNTAEVILNSLTEAPPETDTPQETPPETQPAVQVAQKSHPHMQHSPPNPDWSKLADRLEQENRLEEMEQAILNGVQHIGALASIAHRYELRMNRLFKQGETEAAKAACRKAIDWWYSYAASATSGGEGAALSYERDQNVSRLRRYLD
jgi:hypothetical protein